MEGSKVGYFAMKSRGQEGLEICFLSLQEIGHAAGITITESISPNMPP
jgi:hypothetical protein